MTGAEIISVVLGTALIGVIGGLIAWAVSHDRKLSREMRMKYPPDMLGYGEIARHLSEGKTFEEIRGLDRERHDRLAKEGERAGEVREFLEERQRQIEEGTYL